MKAPMVYMGGKSAIAPAVWERLGNVPNYVDPFCGSCAVPLSRPLSHRNPEGNWPTETLNDANAELQNVWRAIQFDPDGAARAADAPVAECDLHAKGDALFYKRHLLRRFCFQAGYRDACPWACDCPQSCGAFVQRMDRDPAFYCPLAAGWWIWGNSCWIGDNWSRQTHNAKHDADGNAIGVAGGRPDLGDAGHGINRQIPHLGSAGQGVNRKRPHLGNAGQGVNRQRPHLGSAGKGINRKLPHLGSAGQGINRMEFATPQGEALHAYMRELYQRTRRWRVCCGDFERVLGESVTTVHGVTGIFFDPPYGVKSRASCYGEHEDFDVSKRVLEWCKQNGDNPRLRIALCGYEENDTLAAVGWDVLRWKARGGYGSQRKNGVNENSKRETIWFSPACLNPQNSLFQEP